MEPAALRGRRVDFPRGGDASAGGGREFAPRLEWPRRNQPLSGQRHGRRDRTV